MTEPIALGDRLGRLGVMLAAAGQLLRGVRTSLAAYADVDAATATGYRKPRGRRGPITHYLNRDLARGGGDVLDARRMLHVWTFDQLAAPGRRGNAPERTVTLVDPFGVPLRAAVEKVDG